MEYLILQQDEQKTQNREDLVCKNRRCSLFEKKVNAIITKQGKHLRADCPYCGRYIKFISHNNSLPKEKKKKKEFFRKDYYEKLIKNIPATEQRWPYGKKHKGKKLIEIVRDYPDYVEWVFEKMSDLDESWKCLLFDVLEEFNSKNNEKW